MQISVAELAELLKGDVVGDPTALVYKVAKIEEGDSGSLSFLSNPKYEPFIYQTRATAVIVNRNFEPTARVNTTLLKVDDPYASFTLLLDKFSNHTGTKTGTDESAIVSKDAICGKDVYIGAQAFIGSKARIGDGTKILPQVYIGDNVEIGRNCMVYPGVRIYNDSVIGDNCIIHSGAVIGSDGFGFAPLPDRSYKKIPQTGNVVIEADVEIGSNTTIDRATIGSTFIRQGVKIDNLVQVAHNVEIGAHSVIAAQTGISGSTKIGKFCIVGGQVGFAGHLTIADGSVFGAQSGVTGSIKDTDEKWMGYPALEYSKARRVYAMLKNIPDLDKKVHELSKLVAELKNSK